MYILSIKKLIRPLILVFCFFILFDVDADAAYFRNTSGALVIGNNYWEASFSSINGSLKYIIDKTGGGEVCIGSRDDSLWAADFFYESDMYKSNIYKSGSSSNFSYTWDQKTNSLKFYYTSNPAGSGIDADITITVTEEHWFNMRLHLVNKAGKIIKLLYFPNEFMFANANISEALIPILPGMVLKNSYFTERRSYVARYPGWPGVFADFMSVKLANGNISVYAYQNSDSFIPSFLGFAADSEAAGKSYYYHAFGAGTDMDGEYLSPNVKIRVGDGNYVDSIEAYRIDNGIDKYEDIKTKLGSVYELITTAPILKLESTKLKLKFSEYEDLLLKRLPSPLIYHLCGFQIGGFDENVPDLLPPEAAWGTTDDLVQLIQKMKQRGDLFMPYTNPTWWDDESPTLTNIPSGLTIKQIAMNHEDYKPVYELYNYYSGGYVVCPYSQFVKNVLDLKMKEMKETLLSDLIFEDQIGARQWWFDFNENSPTSLSYIDGWIEHTRKYKSYLLSTELGFDRLAETEMAFYGSILLPIRNGVVGPMLGPDDWDIYPMASILLRDKVLLYQHDLADYTMTLFKENFSWNAAFGLLPTMQITSMSSTDFDWMRMISGFSKYVFSNYTDQRIKDYTYISDNLSLTEFDSYLVYTNWNETYPEEVGEHSIAPMGTMIRSIDGTVTAGVFVSYNGVSLGDDEHFIIEERQPDSIIIRHYNTTGATLAVKLPENWDASKTKVLCHMPDGGLIPVIQYRIEGRYIIFDAIGKKGDIYADYYKIISVD